MEVISIMGCNVCKIIFSEDDYPDQCPLCKAETRLKILAAEIESLERESLERPEYEIRSFEHFPADSFCPVCSTSEDSRCVLIPIDRTFSDGISEALPVHLKCAISKHYNADLKLLYTKTLKSLNESRGEYKT